MTPKLYVNWEEVAAISQSEHDTVVTERDLLVSELWHRIYTKYEDWRFHINTQQNLDDYYNFRKEYDNWFSVINWNYFLDFSLTLPDSFWELDTLFVYMLSTNFSNPWSRLPDIPVTADNFQRLHFRISSVAWAWMWSNWVDQIPTTWRNAKGVFAFNFERQELSSDQQVSLIEWYEREILAGMWEDYVSTSTTDRQIDLQSTSTRRNDSLVAADLVALGWTIVNSTQLEKMLINPSNGVAYRHRIIHNS